MPVYPGDPLVEIDTPVTLAEGDAANVSRLRMGAHTGTRVDAPAHFLAAGRRVIDLPLEALIGDARVVAARVRLVGIDSLSVERFKSADHETHRVLLANDVVILEGLDLRGIAPGVYELLCLPLKLADGAGDGAPARAVLRDVRARVRDDPQREH